MAERGEVCLRRAGGLRHLGIGRACIGLRVRLLIDHDDVLVADLDTAAVLAEFTIDPARGYQAKKKGPGENQGPSSRTMSRDICERCPETSQGGGWGI